MNARTVRRSLAVAAAAVTLGSGICAVPPTAEASPARNAASGGDGPYQRLALQVATFLFQSADNSDVTVADWDGDGVPDVLAVEKSPSFGNRTRVHIVTGSTNYTVEIGTGDTALLPTDETFDFAFGDWDGDGVLDLFAIKKARTGTNSTEVHILSGASNFQQFLLQTGTALVETDATFDFALTDWDHDGRSDLVAIKKSRTGTNSTEVHILSGASDFHQFILQTGTALVETDANTLFGLADWDNDGRPDLFAFATSPGGFPPVGIRIFS